MVLGGRYVFSVRVAISLQTNELGSRALPNHSPVGEDDKYSKAPLIHGHRKISFLSRFFLGVSIPLSSLVFVFFNFTCVSRLFAFCTQPPSHWFFSSCFSLIDASRQCLLLLKSVFFPNAENAVAVELSFGQHCLSLAQARCRSSKRGLATCCICDWASCSFILDGIAPRCAS